MMRERTYPTLPFISEGCVRAVTSLNLLDQWQQVSAQID